MVYFVIAFVVIAITTMPLIYMTVSSFKPDTEVFTLPPTFFPSKWTLKGYQELFNRTNVPVALVNSFFVAGSASILGVILSTGFCYAFTRFRFPGMGFISILMLMVYILPKILILIPVYSLWVLIGIKEGLFPLIIMYVSSTLPFAIWLMRAYFAGVPIELEEAAMVDGATRVIAFLRIVLPLTRPGIISTLIFTFILSWNEVLYASIFATSEKTQVISSALSLLAQQQAGWYSWPMVNAAAVAATLPMIVFFAFIQRQLISGFTAGAIKG
jgi:ABC-type glycerol-3-phosphate transport system permease component